MSPRGVEGHLRRLVDDGRGRGRLFNLCFLALFAVEISSQILTLTNFSLQGMRSYIEGTRLEPVLDVFAFWQLRRHQRGLLVACLRAWRIPASKVPFLQALKQATRCPRWCLRSCQKANTSSTGSTLVPSMYERIPCSEKFVNVNI